MLGPLQARWSGALRVLAGCLTAAIVAACGGGGDGDGVSAPIAGVSGYVVKGPVASTTVALYSVAVDGTRSALGTTASDATGFYRFDVKLPVGAVLLAEASGGTYTDEISANRVALPVALRAVTVAPGTPSQLSISPFSEAAAREIDSGSPKNWSAGRVAQVNAAFADNWAAFLHLTPVDFSSDDAASSATADDFVLGLFLGGFSGMLHQLGNPQMPAPFDQALGALRTVLADQYDDQFAPRWLRGTVDFVDVIGLSVTNKRELKGLLTLRNAFASETEIAAALPTGVATGSASAPMPNDAFELVPDLNMVPQSPVGTLFNARGALVAYQIGSSFNTYRYLYSGSVGELYGDGDIGIGRWHGGVVFDAADGRTLEGATNPQILTASQGTAYALGRPATGVPSCGIRLAALVGSTLPTQTAGPGVKPVTGLTRSSRIAVQYFGGTAYVGLDIGLQMADGSVFQATTSGGVSAPWASGASTGADGSFSVSFMPAGPPAQLPELRIDVNGLLAGAGGRKVVGKLRIGSPNVDAMMLAAAFSAPDTKPDTSGCATSSTGDGSAISPAPVDGTYAVFAGVDSPVWMGVPLFTSFRSSGAILTAGLSGGPPVLTIPSDTPTFELAGNADVAIGRAMGPFTLWGVNYVRSLPFAAAKAPGVFPTSGSRRYTMVSSSAVIAAISAGGTVSELTGQISSATVDIHFGENPPGTANPWYGSVLYSIQGSVGGTPFTLTNPRDSTGGVSPLTYFRDVAAFSGSGIEGAVSGANAQFAVLRFQSGIGGVPLQGVLFLQAP
jgi:hypothetical protein